MYVVVIALLKLFTFYLDKQRSEREVERGERGGRSNAVNSEHKKGRSYNSVSLLQQNELLYL